MVSLHHRSGPSPLQTCFTGFLMIGSLLLTDSPSATAAGLAIETHLSNGIALANHAVGGNLSETPSASIASGARAYLVDDHSNKGGGMRGYLRRLWKKFQDLTSSSSTSTSTSSGTTSTSTTSTSSGSTSTTTTSTTSTTSSPIPTPTPSTGQLPGTMTFTGMEGGSNPSPQTINITNTGGGTLSWSASQSASWLTLNPASGTTTTETDVITVAANTAGLSQNTYTTTITVSAPGSTTATQQVPVTLTVTPPTSTIGQSPASLTFVAQQGGSQPSVQTFNITNKGKGTLTWTVSEATGWLSLTPASGTTTTETDVIAVTVNTAGLTTNTYTAPIAITASGASNTPQQLMVSLAITAPASGIAKLTWDPNTESDLAGYKVYAGTSSAAYGPPIDVGKVTTFEVINLTAGKTYYFSIKAYNTSSLESGFSNEVSKTIN